MLPILLIALLGTLAQFVLPWWSLAVVAFGVCLGRSTGAGQAFGAGFFGSMLVWLVYALLIHLRTDGIFTARMGLLLFKTESAVLPVVVSAILGGLVGGLAGLTGFFVRQVVGNRAGRTT